MMGFRSFSWLLLLVLPLVSGEARADAIVRSRAMAATTIAEIFVEADRVRVELEIGAQDLPAFLNLMPDWLNEELGGSSAPQAERLATFFAEDLPIRVEADAPLPGRVLELAPRPRVRRDEITGEPVPAVEGEDESVVFAVLEYPLPEAPVQLFLDPPAARRRGETPSIGFVAYHLGVPVTDFRYLSRGLVLDLDWDDPWYSQFQSRTLRRTYQAPMHVFLYVESTEVRVEVIVRPVDLEHWIDLGIGERRTIPVDAQAEMKRRVGEFLAQHTPVVIDGEPSVGMLDRVNFLRRTLRSSSVVDPPEDLDKFGATLGAIFVHPRVGLPQEVELVWDLFSERIQRVPASATDEAGPLPTFLEPGFEVLRWENFLRNPTDRTLVQVDAPPPAWRRWLVLLGGACAVLCGIVLVVQVVHRVAGRGFSRPAVGVAVGLALGAAAALAGGAAGRVDDDRARAVLRPLLHNVYRAFDYYEEGAIYDVLDQSVTGDLLAQIYLETRRSLVLASQGGARAKVQEIELLEVDARPAPEGEGFVAQCLWRVVGSVGHWGHIHQRTNQYRADLTVRPVEGRWKLDGMELLDEERI